MSSIVNKVKDALHTGDKHNSHPSQPEGTHGPHNSRIANAADPRVDSDRDGRAAPMGSNTMGTTHGTTHRTAGTAEGTHGPHSSRLANAADPRVDSDRDGSNTMGAGRTAGMTGSSGLHSGSGMTGTTGGLRTAGHGEGGAFSSSGTAEGTYGPHSSRLANAADPRVDSDRDGSNTMGGRTGGMTGTAGFGSHSTSNNGIAGTTGGLGQSNTHSHAAGSGMTGMSGTHGAPAGTYGPHNSRLANAADPRVDSDRDGRGAIGTGPGPASNTAGPHKSDMMNKMDPRVDSDLDGSKTVGENKTYQQGSVGGVSGVSRKDPHDAAQVPPSVLQQVVGPPVVEHDDHNHGRARRNSRATEQEAFRGV